jgi:hypothetical protein
MAQLLSLRRSGPPTILRSLATSRSSCKTWCLTLVGAFLSLAGATHAPSIVTLALVPVIVLGFMDAMYLTQERAYRKLYDQMVALIRAKQYTIDRAFEADAPWQWRGILAAFGSWSIWPIYGGLIAAYIVAKCAGWLALLAAPAKVT